MKRLSVIIVNYRQAELTIECLRSLVGQLEPAAGRGAIVVDNHSEDGSAGAIEAAIDANGWRHWARVIESGRNGGFAAGNNVGIEAEEAEFYLLLNSDARVTPGAIDALLEAARIHDRAGLIGPRLQDPDGTPQVSCFRYRTPVSELLRAAGTSLLDRLFPRHVVPAGTFEEPARVDWVSFACVLVRGEVVRRVGLMDERYFMYFEDIDYARRVQEDRWFIVHDPGPQVIHLRGGSSSVKSAMAEGRRVPRYYYESRSRYFAKNFGGVPGLVCTNVLWLLGRAVARLRRLVSRRPEAICANEARDNWINWRHPMADSAPSDRSEAA
jgi:GT2 family glycosyltransferase